MKQFVAGIAVLIVVGLVVKHWVIILIIIGVVVTLVSLWSFGAHMRSQRRTRIEYDRAEQKRLAARADEEQRQYLDGNARGIYGKHMPADLDGDLRIGGSFRKLPPTMRAWRSEQ